jgi:signal transduction histidine kinase
VPARLPAAIAGAIVAAAVTVRRRWPLEALVLAICASVAQDAFGGASKVSAVATVPAAILGFYAAGAFLSGPRARLGLALGVTGLAVDVAITTRAADDLFFDVVVIALLPWAVGQMATARARRELLHREQAERLDSERELRTARAAIGERARIARELHDVIAHSVSVMVIQAGGARIVMDADPARAEQSLLLVERAGRDALAELRRLLGMLDGGLEQTTLAPQPGLADVEQLIERARDAGLDASLEVEGDTIVVSPALDLCAYRIVQEAITNAIRHAGPARSTVRIRWQHDALELEIADDGHGPTASDGAGRGHGIAGMRERAALHGGHVRAGAGASGGFVVHARLPLVLEPVS